MGQTCSRVHSKCYTQRKNTFNVFVGSQEFIDLFILEASKLTNNFAHNRLLLLRDHIVNITTRLGLKLRERKQRPFGINSK